MEPERSIKQQISVPLKQDRNLKKNIELIGCMAGGENSASSSKTAEDRYEGFKITKSNRVFYLRLNRPARKNALTGTMYFDICKALQEAAEDDEVSVAVVTGTGDYYCSGNDLKNFTEAPSVQRESLSDPMESLRNFVRAFIDFPKPLIALVNGPAVGIAVSTLGLFDAVYCTDRATFHTPFTQLGQCPEACSSYIFPKIMGRAKAGELLLFNRKITAQEALERNLVTRVFPDADFHRETGAIVASYASFPPQSMKYSKMLIRDAERELLHKVNEAEVAELSRRFQSEECANAIMSFFMKKQAKL